MTTSAHDLAEGLLSNRDRMLADLINEEVERQKRQSRRRPDQPKVTQGYVAAKVFNKNQQWLSRRLTGDTALTPIQLLDLGDFLGIDIIDWYNAVKRDPDNPPTVFKRLPRLDSNQQPFDYKSQPCDVIDLADYRTRYNKLNNLTAGAVSNAV